MSRREVCRLGSSLRVLPPEETLLRVAPLAERLGITRVTDITRLDRAGVPVYASIRPGAAPGSLCVNAGKGLRRIDARVGALMEAVEFAYAEPARAQVALFEVSARDILDTAERPEAILDLCPFMGAEIVLDAPVVAVRARDAFESDRTTWIPAESVLIPYRSPYGSWFGCHTNGLSSGNTTEEALLHGLLELIERDVRSFQSVDDRSALVQLETLPAPLRDLVQAVEQAGLVLCLRTLSNEFGLPYFMAIVSEPDPIDPIYVSGGYGCHLDSQIAAARALTEALQSRLSFVHGGRDDLTARYERFDGLSAAARARYALHLWADVSRRDRLVSFEHVESSRVQSVSEGLELTRARLSAQGFNDIWCVRLNPDSDPVVVLRVVVPGLEFFTESTARVGPRLRNYVADWVARHAA